MKVAGCRAALCPLPTEDTCTTL